MPFEKGKSGNPGGRPKSENLVRELAQKQGPAAVMRLSELMHDDDKRVSVSACQALLDRGYGRPMQAIEAKVDASVTVEIVRLAS